MVVVLGSFVGCVAVLAALSAGLGGVVGFSGLETSAAFGGGAGVAGLGTSAQVALRKAIERMAVVNFMFSSVRTTLSS